MVLFQGKKQNKQACAWIEDFTQADGKHTVQNMKSQPRRLGLSQKCDQFKSWP